MVVHNGAAMVIARRSCKFSESVPEALTDKYVNRKHKEEFNSCCC